MGSGMAAVTTQGFPMLATTVWSTQVASSCRRPRPDRAAPLRLRGSSCPARCTVQGPCATGTQTYAAQLHSLLMRPHADHRGVRNAATHRTKRNPVGLELSLVRGGLQSQVGL